MNPLTTIHYLDQNRTKTMQKIYTIFGGGIQYGYENNTSKLGADPTHAQSTGITNIKIF